MVGGVRAGSLPPEFLFQKELELLRKIGIKEAHRCFLTVFEATFWKLELQRNF